MKTSKLDERNTATLEKSGNKVMAAKYDVIIFFTIYHHLKQSGKWIPGE